jgi:hypothetical protein
MLMLEFPDSDKNGLNADNIWPSGDLATQSKTLIQRGAIKLYYENKSC